MKRVVITGFSAITSLGDNWHDFKKSLQQGENAVVKLAQWDEVSGLNTKLAAPIKGYKTPSHYKRKQIRSMGKVSIMSTQATENALTQAGLLGTELLTSGDVGISYGSSMGSTSAIPAFGDLLKDNNMDGITATSYLQMMAHTTPVNVGVFFGLKGRTITTSSACTSSSQGIGYAYEAIKYGRQKAMVAGGAEELCLSSAVVFDTLFAASINNDNPKDTPRPFDQDRDGLVIGEGACSFILEDIDYAKARGATILAEIVGFGTNADGKHVTQPTAETMKTAMVLALEDANLSPSDIGYVNAHGTSTEKGDIAESYATYHTLGNVPISSLKSYLGHTLGACGAIEAWASINMMQDNWFAPTLNLKNVDSQCAPLDYIQGEGRELKTDYVMSNNFAFGGINTSLIFKRWAN